MKKYSTLTVSLILLMNTMVFSNDKPMPKGEQSIIIQNQEIFGAPFLNITQKISTTVNTIKVETDTIMALKSPKKGMLFSLLVPGSGELYAKSWVKGTIFLGIEVFAWTTYASNKKKGDDLEKEFIQYAEDYWSYDRWNQWWSSLPEGTRQQLAHHQLPETKTQQYYEMIGKYQKFNAGWEGVSPAAALTDTSKLSLHYMEMRGKSNDKLKLAGAMMGIVLANHIFSSLDAVWTVSRFNKNVKPEVRMKYVMINNKPTPVADFAINW